MDMQLTSPAFSEGGTIPKEYTGFGMDVSPVLQWSEPPAETKSLALICDDPDAPKGTWVHWVLFNVPADVRSLAKALPTGKVLDNGGKQGKNDFGSIGYGGPAPPAGKPHRYFFKLYALDASLSIPSGSTKDELVKAMQGHVLAECQLMGIFGR